MDIQQHIPFLSIFVSMLTAISIPLIKNNKFIRNITIISLGIIILLSSILIVYLNNIGGYFTYQLGHTPAPWGNELRAGLMDTIMALVFSLVMFLSVFGGLQSIEKDIKPEKQRFYYIMLNLLMSSLLALVYTNDIFTAYVFIEINTVAACAIVLAKDSGDTIIASIKYLIMSVLGSGLFLFSIAILYSLTGHLVMSNMNQAISNLSINYQFPLTVALLLIIVSLAVKSALFPFHTWLPDAHGTATSSASAVLSALVLKGYIILLVKIIYRVYGIEIVNKLNILPILLVLGILGMLMGSIYALRQKELKKMIAYSSISQIGYIYMGIGIGTPIGIIAAMFHIIVHAFTKSLLFLSAGNFIEIANSKYISDMDGIGNMDKISGLSFLVGGLSMIGIPLFGGFISKIQFINSGLFNDNYALFVLLCLAISTLLNAMYYIPVILQVFKKSNKTRSSFTLKYSNKYSLIILIIINVFLGLAFKPILNALLIGFSNIG